MSNHAVSPTQISNYRACPRKIAWQFTAGIRPSSGPGAELGDRVHKCLEKYLVFNQLDYTNEATKILEPALPFFPPPLTCNAEEKFRFEWDGLLFTGRTDARTHLRIYDLKTTKDARYAKSKEQLEKDPQAIIYSKAFGGSPGRWVYTLTTKRSAWPVDFEPRTSGEEAARILEDSRSIGEIVRRRANPLDIPPNTAACGDYGGCPYRNNCTDLSPLRNIFKNQMNIDLSRLIAPAPPPAAPAFNPPESSESGAPPVPEPEAPKTKRPRKAKADATPPSEAPPSLSIGVTQPSTEEASDNRTQVAPLTVAMLFIDCLPDGQMGLDVINVSVAIEAVREGLKKDGVQDYRFLEYGQGSGIIAAKAIEYLGSLEASRKGELLLYVDSRLPESKLVMGSLTAKATVKVRAT